MDFESLLTKDYSDKSIWRKAIHEQKESLYRGDFANDVALNNQKQTEVSPHAYDLSY